MDPQQPPEVESAVEDTDDGGAIVSFPEETVEKSESFYANLVEDLDASTLQEIGRRLVEFCEQDHEDRKKRDEQYEEGLKRTGLANEAPGGANFTGASRTVHPMLASACVDFGARTIRELMPSDDVVKSFIPGKSTRQRVEKSDRVTACLNWQLKKQIVEFRSELEQLLIQLPLGGSQYLYVVHDAEKRRPTVQFWPIDDVYLPYAASNFYTAERITMVERITKSEYDRRRKAGIYSTDIVASALPPEVSGARDQAEKIEGKTASPFNRDELMPILRVFTYLEIEEGSAIESSEQEDPEEHAEEVEAGLENEAHSSSEFIRAPYIVELDPNSSKVLSIVRNWERQDETMQPMSWLIDFNFIPWRGAVAIGLGQLIGSLSASSTGALRALLDSAHVNNLPTLVKLKGANFSGQSVALNATEITEIEGGIAGTDDIRKLVMAVPFNPPSTVLFELLGWLTEQGNSVVRTTFDGLLEAGSPNLPVGTTLALVEQGMKVLGAIHLRLYHSMTRVLEAIYRINRLYLTDEQVKGDVGEVLAKRDDFQGPLDVLPVADPETFSDAQRFAQIQMVAGRAALLPQLYDLRKVEELILQRTKIPDAEDLLLPAPKPIEMNSVNENAAAAFGRPVSAFPAQDHLSHLQVHLDFISSPMFGSFSLIAPRALPVLINHVAEHLVLWYVTSTVELVESQVGDIAKFLEHRDPASRAELDKTLAIASHRVLASASETFAGVPPVIQRAQQLMQQFAPQMPQDPTIAAAQIQANVKSQEMARKSQSDQEKNVINLKDREAERQSRERSDLARQAAEDRRMKAKVESDQMQTEMQVSSKERMNTQDNETALTIAQAEIESGEKVAVETGTGINPGN